MKKNKALAVAAGLLIASVTAVSVAGVASAGSEPAPAPAKDPGRVKPLIVGGQPATEDYPFIASMQYAEPGDRLSPHRCGGALIAPEWVLTAAHCIADEKGKPLDPSEYRVRVGSTDNLAGTEYEIEMFVEHPDYGTNSERYADIGLIKLDGAAPQEPIESVAAPEAGTTLRMVGWGDTDPEADSNPRILQQLDSELLPFDNCVYGDEFDITPGDLCMAADTVVGPCYGDSGSPLLYEVDGVWHTVGVVSRGPGEGHCRIGNEVYTSTDYYWDWIENQLAAG